MRKIAEKVLKTMGRTDKDLINTAPNKAEEVLFTFFQKTALLMFAYRRILKSMLWILKFTAFGTTGLTYLSGETHYTLLLSASNIANRTLERSRCWISLAKRQKKTWSLKLKLSW
jgi:hypothetical protein